MFCAGNIEGLTEGLCSWFMLMKALLLPCTPWRDFRY
jgi:hypothetical protein